MCVSLIDRRVKFIDTMNEGPRAREEKGIYLCKNLGIFNGHFNRRLSTFFDMWHSRSRSSFLVFSSAAVPETRNPNGGPLCPPPIPTVVFADAEEVGRALDDAGFLRPARLRPLSCAPSSSPSRFLFAPSVEGRNARLIRGGGERNEKRGEGGERERKKEKSVEISRRRKRGRGKEESKRRARRILATNRKPRHRKSHFRSQSPLASVAYFDRIRESLERRGAISWRTCRDPIAAPARRLED